MFPVISHFGIPPYNSKKTMRKLFIIALVLASGAAFALTPAKKNTKKGSKTTSTQTVTLTTKADSVSYAAGMAMTRGLDGYLKEQFGVTAADMDEFAAGFREALGKTKDSHYMARIAGAEIARMVEGRMVPNISKEFEDTDHQIDSTLFAAGFLAAVSGDTTLMATTPAAKYFTEVSEADKKKRDEAWKVSNAEWIAANAKKDSITVLPSGLQYKVVRQGTGDVAKADDEVTVKYEGTTIDGNVFDSSYKRNPQTTTFRPNQVIKGWTEALTMMPVGSKWILYIPQELAYGERQAGPIKPYSTLIFTVEVESVKRAEPKPATEETTAKPAKPAKSKKTKK